MAIKLSISPTPQTGGCQLNPPSYTRQGRSPYSVIFLARIACCYVVFELSTSMLEQAQALLVDYFDSLERGQIRGDTSEFDPIDFPSAPINLVVKLTDNMSFICHNVDNILYF